MGRNNERRECGGESKSYCSRSKRQVGESPLDRKQKQKQNRRNFVTSQKMASITNPLPWMKLFLLGNDIVGINDSFIFALCSLPLWLHTACTLMEWNPFRLTKSFSFNSCWVPESSHGSRRRSQLHQGTLPCRKTLAWLLAVRRETATKWIFSASGLEQATHLLAPLRQRILGGRRCHRWVEAEKAAPHKEIQRYKNLYL